MCSHLPVGDNWNCIRLCHMDSRQLLECQTSASVSFWSADLNILRTRSKINILSSSAHFQAKPPGGLLQSHQYQLFTYWILCIWEPKKLERRASLGTNSKFDEQKPSSCFQTSNRGQSSKYAQFGCTALVETATPNLVTWRKFMGGPSSPWEARLLYWKI